MGRLGEFVLYSASLCRFEWVAREIECEIKCEIKYKDI